MAEYRRIATLLLARQAEARRGEDTRSLLIASLCHPRDGPGAVRGRGGADPGGPTRPDAARRKRGDNVSGVSIKGSPAPAPTAAGLNTLSLPVPVPAT